MRIMVMGNGRVSARPGWAGVMVLLFLLAACASEDFWYQKGKTEADMQNDRYECTTELRDKYGMYGADKNSPAYVADLRQCMIKKGYTRLEDTKKYCFSWNRSASRSPPRCFSKTPRCICGQARGSA